MDHGIGADEGLRWNRLAHIEWEEAKFRMLVVPGAHVQGADFLNARIITQKGSDHLPEAPGRSRNHNTHCRLHQIGSSSLRIYGDDPPIIHQLQGRDWQETPLSV